MKLIKSSKGEKSESKFVRDMDVLEEFGIERNQLYFSVKNTFLR